MKKLIIITVLTFTLLSGTDVYGQVSLGIKGSFDLFNMTIKGEDEDKTETSMVPKFDAGVFAEIAVADEFFLRPELLLVNKGTKFKEATQKTTLSLSYLQLPVMFLYKGALSDGKVLLGFGPYLAMGIGGKHKIGDTEYDVKYKNDVKGTIQNAVYFKPLDTGFMLMAGYELKNGISFALNTSMGLTNIEPKSNGEKPEGSVKNAGFGLTLGYRFGKN